VLANRRGAKSPVILGAALIKTGLMMAWPFIRQSGLHYLPQVQKWCYAAVSLWPRQTNNEHNLTRTPRTPRHTNNEHSLTRTPRTQERAKLAARFAVAHSQNAPHKIKKQKKQTHDRQNRA